MTVCFRGAGMAMVDEMLEVAAVNDTCNVMDARHDE
jgi:hypothetical protein